MTIEGVLIKTAAMAIAAVALGGCVWLKTAPEEANGEAASPPILAPLNGAPDVVDAEDWRERRAPLLRELFQSYVYGYFPPPSKASIIDQRVVSENAFNGAARVEELMVKAPNAEGEVQFGVVLITPTNVPGPLPVIIAQNFCGNHNAVPLNGVTRSKNAPGMCDGSWAEPIIIRILGEHIQTAPLEKIIERGYAYAAVYPGDIVPDKDETAQSALAAFHTTQDKMKRWGAIGAWAWGVSRVVDVLETLDRFDADKIAVYGHSRLGKSALVAAAYDERIDIVLAHQSGTGGATLTRSKAGESLKQITTSYPHWFAPIYAAYAGREGDLPIDQHMLIALIAPRPVLLGNARRDVWSDPVGAFRAAEGADPVYELFGGNGLDQPNLVDINYDADIAFHMRPGGHGVNGADWEAFLSFLDAQTDTGN